MILLPWDVGSAFIQACVSSALGDSLIELIVLELSAGEGHDSEF
jgi:hypothetical protein